MRKHLILSSVLILTNFAVMADSSIGNFYVSTNINLGSASNVPNSSFISLTPETSIETGSDIFSGLGLLAGYNFNNYFSAEISYLYGWNANNNIKLYYGDVQQTDLSLTDTNQFLTANAKGTLPLNKSFSLFGKLGAGVNFAAISASGWANGVDNISALNMNSSNFTLLLGLGAEWNINKHWGLYLNDSFYIPMASPIEIKSLNDIPTTNSFSFGNANFIGLGVTYNFL